MSDPLSLSLCMQLVTDTMRGAVLAFAQRAPDNKNALNISFGDTGYATALARVFQRVRGLNIHNTVILNLLALISLHAFWTSRDNCTSLSYFLHLELAYYSSYATQKVF